MIIIYFTKIIATALASATVLSSAAFLPTTNFTGIFAGIEASAQTGISTPVLKKSKTYSDKLNFTVSNLKNYSGNAKFKVYVNNNYVKTFTLKELKAENRVSVSSDGNNYLKADKTYSVKVKIVNGDISKTSNTVKVKTAKHTYYKINKSVQLYKLTKGKYKKSSKCASTIIVTGRRCGEKGVTVAGKSRSKYTDKWVRITSGSYKGYYVIKTASTESVQRSSENAAKILKVCNYAASMNGGRYVWGGSSYRATDCSGLTMQAYAKVGVNISHSAAYQAKKGKAVSSRNMKAGDIIICNNYGHVILYLGNGKMVHAMNSNDGIKIQSASNLQYYRINTVRRIFSA